MKRLSRRHDVVAVSVGDEREINMPDVGQLILMNPETCEEHFVDTSSYAFKKWMEEYRNKVHQKTADTLKNSGVERVQILTKDDYAEAVVRFFRARSRSRLKK